MATGVGLQVPVLPVNFGSTVIHEQRDAIREQLARILASSLFKHSNHYRVLLRYIVEQALEGNPGPWKERILGVEVFGRDPLYDTNLDPVVRTSACEVRKRIAQYYSEPGRDLEIRIEQHRTAFDCHFPDGVQRQIVAVDVKSFHEKSEIRMRALRSQILSSYRSPKSFHILFR